MGIGRNKETVPTKLVSAKTDAENNGKIWNIFVVPPELRVGKIRMGKTQTVCCLF